MSYVSFAGLIEPFSDYPFTALHGVSEGFPNVVIAEIERNLWLIDWDDLTTRQRMELAMQHDIHHDPAIEPEWTHFSDICDLIDNKKEEVAKWQAMPEPLPSEALAKEQRLLALNGELAELENRFNEPYPAPPVAETATPAPLVSETAEQPAPAHNTVKPAPVVEVPEWKGLARVKALAIIKRDQKKDLHPSQVAIADEIAKEFRNANLQIVGAGKKPLTGAYIKRHALRGVSSEQGRQLSTSPSRGK